MSFLSAIRVALATLMVNKGRSMLTSLGIVIGISAVIALVSAGEGARLYVDSRLDSLGKNMILIRAGARNNQGMIADFSPLTPQDAQAMRTQLRLYLSAVAEVQYSHRMVVAGSRSIPAPIAGTTEDILQVRKWKVVPGGRFVSRDDNAKAAPVCVVGETIRTKLFPDRPAVGQMIRVGYLQLRVVGVLEKKGESINGADQDDLIFVPLSTLQHKMGAGEKVGTILAEVRSESMTEKAKSEVRRVLRETHHVKPGGSENFDVSSIADVAGLATVITDTLEMLVLVIASVSLLVGGIGVMNVMLVAVTERTREIGIRMAVGATPWDVLTQFLLEAMVLALIGGLIGIGVGVGAAIGLSFAIGWPLSLSWFYILLACGVSAAVGITFGYYPALKASRLVPIEALRYE